MPDLTAFEAALRARVRGEVAFDKLTRGLYATDASLYQIEPVGVVAPLDNRDVIAAVTTAAEFGVPILPRAGGTSLGGSCVAAALVIDVSRHLNQLLDLSVEERWARVQPGMVRDNLNALLAPHGLMYAPDPATGNRANVGGMIGNNSSGMRSVVYGKTVDHLLATKVVLTDGTVMELRAHDAAGYAAKAAGNDREAQIYREFGALVAAHRDEIHARYPKIMRRVQGYNLDEFVTGADWNLAKLICGSEGTLATILEAKVQLVPVPRATALCVAHFATLGEALRSVQVALDRGPSAVEIFDATVLSLARQSPTTAQLCDWIQGEPAAVLAIEFYGDDAAAATELARQAGEALVAAGSAYASTLCADSPSQQRVWAVRKAGLGLMLAIRGDRKPVPFIEDAAVPIPVLPDYIEGVLAICAQHETPVILYAHCSVGLLHVRPILNIKDRADLDRMQAIADAAFALVMRLGGSWSGEHGDGLVRSAYLERFFGTELYGAFRQVKALFDPQGLMNPGKIVNGPPMDQDLRFGPDYQADLPASWFGFRRDGGLQGAIEMCNGVGACRQTLGGTMCPSYRATRDEVHSTRGRANALRLAMSGQLGMDGFTDASVFEALDLCLSCKACKTECPSNVDVARLKSEWLQHWHDQHGSTLRERMVRDSPVLASLLAGPLAPVANVVSGLSLTRWLLERLCGLDARRIPPAYARQPFARWFDRRGERPSRPERRVVLFDDTWLSFHEPGVGIAATELLEGCGYEVVRAGAGCCQRPAISHGFLREARRDGERTLRNLDRWLQAGVPVVCCEPSCCSSLADDLPDLIEDRELAERAAAGIVMIDVFLARELAAGRIEAAFSSPEQEILLHGHCHQKALYGTAAMKSLLGRVPGLQVREVDSGCCGMAGSFGYEQEHYELSRQVGEERLLPAVRAAAADTTVVACGFSCRHQVRDLAGREARHFVEVLRAD